MAIVHEPKTMRQRSQSAHNICGDTKSSSTLIRPTVVVADEHSPRRRAHQTSARTAGQVATARRRRCERLAFPPWDNVRANARHERGLVHIKLKGKTAMSVLKAILKSPTKKSRGMLKAIANSRDENPVVRHQELSVG